MARKTRQTSKLREAEGIPPSPPTELPTELSGTRRPRKKKAPLSTQALLPSEIDEVASSSSESQQHLLVPDQTLREGNAGGYVHNAPSVESNREQQASLTETDISPISFSSRGTATSRQRSGAEEAAASSKGSPRSSPVGSTHTSPHSPSATSTLVAQIANPQPSPSYTALVHQGVPNSHRTKEAIAAVQSVSTQTDGLAASGASQVADHTALPRLQEVTHDISVHRDPHLQAFKPLGLYAYNSEISVLPSFCTVTLHLGGGREIRISQASANAIRKISDILQRDPMSQYERNWLTPREIEEAEAEAEAEAKAERQQQSASKRKRNKDTEMPQAQKRRITPSPTASAKMVRRMQFMRTNRSRLGRSLAAMRADPLGEEEAGPYNQNGDLQLFRTIPRDTQDEDPMTNNPIVGPITLDIGTADEASRGVGRTPPSNEGTNAVDTEDFAVESAQVNEQSSQNPQTGSWRLGSLVNSVSRYVPSFRRQRTPLPTPQTSTPIARDRNQPVAQTETRRPSTMAAHSDFAQRLQNSQTAANKTFRTKENIEAMKKVKAERERIKEEWASLAEAKRVTEQERLEIAETKRITEQEKQDVAEAHRAAIADQLPGAKRRRPSPRVIPHPKGVSYGFDPAFFCVSDDSEEEEESSPSRKIRRVSGPDHTSSNTRMANTQATPSAPVLRTSPSGRATEYNGSRFSNSPPNVFGQSTVHSGAVISKNDPNFNHSGHFEVPWSPSSSEGDSTGEEDITTSVVDQSPHLLPPTTHHSTGNDSEYPAPASSPQKPAMGARYPPVTPASKQVVTAPETQRDPEAAKTLERNRQLLRAKMAGQNKSVLSPKDIQSPSKAQVPSQAATQATPQLTNAAVFFQPQQISTGAPDPPLDNDHESSILGAASRKAPKSPARMLAETLPSIQDRLNKLQSYNDYQQAMDPRASEALESLWKEADESTAGKDFYSTFKEFSDAQKQDSADFATAQSQNLQHASDDEATDDEDHASLYEDEDDNMNKEQGNDADNGLSEETNEDDEAPSDESEENDSTTPPLTALPTAFRDYSMDPAVAAYLKEQWTAEDEAFASDEFKTQIASAI
ncbi:MAG: hypothetical protein Q9186_001855 [Xanthomendoza sp. 1 TL-2023]